jgi:hypothetical protein
MEAQVHAHIHPTPHGLPADQPEVPITASNWVQRPMAVPPPEHSLYREPLRPRVSVTAARHGTDARVAGRYPGLVFGAAGIHSCSGPRVWSPPRSFLPPNRVARPACGSRDFCVHAELGSLPPRAVDMLAIRIEQLTAEGLSPSKVRGLAGRSLRNPTARRFDWTTHHHHSACKQERWRRGKPRRPSVAPLLHV